MLIRNATLELIRTGEVSLAFRRWRRPTVKAGGTLKTRIGLLAIDQVDQISLQQLSATDAKLAGYASKRVLLDELQGRDGKLYRIQLRYLGADPRVELRQDDDLSDDQFAELQSRLQRMDNRSANGPWTRAVLELIASRPETLAAELAADFGMEKAPFKTNVRKLKNLGLTISHKIGYSLSARGKAVLARLK